jgi:hypothetical protein
VEQSRIVILAIAVRDKGIQFVQLFCHKYSVEFSFFG